MNEHPFLDRIKPAPIFAAVSAPSADSALKSAEAAIAGGLTAIEIRLSTPGAYRVISDLRRVHADAVLVGAGEVVSTEMADRAIKAGAQFLSMPHTDEAILTMARERGLLGIAGALTPSEVMRAWNLGCPIVAVYPVGPFGGSAYIQMLAATFDGIRLMPAGGVTTENLAEHYRAGAFAAVIGAGLFSAADAQGNAYSNVTERARALLETVRSSAR